MNKDSKSRKSSVCIIANHLIKQGVTRSEAMRMAWRTVKQRVIHTKTAGVTHGNRQALLYRLTRYSAAPRQWKGCCKFLQGKHRWRGVLP